MGGISKSLLKSRHLQWSSKWQYWVSAVLWLHTFLSMASRLVQQIKCVTTSENGTYFSVDKFTAPKTNQCPLKRDYFNRNYIFQPLIFRGHFWVFREVPHQMKQIWELWVAVDLRHRTYIFSKALFKTEHSHHLTWLFDFGQFLKLKHVLLF